MELENLRDEERRSSPRLLLKLLFQQEGSGFVKLFIGFGHGDSLFGFQGLLDGFFKLEIGYYWFFRTRFKKKEVDRYWILIVWSFVGLVFVSLDGFLNWTLDFGQ